MKGALFALLAVGATMALMLVIGQFGRAPAAAPASATPPVRAIARQPAPAVSPAAIAPVHGVQHAATSDDLTLRERIEQWIEPWQERRNAAPDTQRASAAEHLRAGRYEKAAQAFDRLLTASPNDAVLLRGEASALCRLGQYDDALPLLERAIELQPREAATRFQYAVALTRLDRRLEAVSVLQKLVSDDSGHMHALFALAVLQQSLGQKQEALATWRRVTSTIPGTQPAHEIRSVALNETTFCEALAHHGEVALELEQNREGADCFQQVVNRRPEDALAWCNLGIARAALEQEEEALKALDEALRLKPDLVPAMNQKAYLFATRYRSSKDPADRQHVMDLCLRSLALQSYQPNLLALKNAINEAERTASAPARKDNEKDE